MCARPWWTTRFSPRFLNAFLRLPAPSFLSGVAPWVPLHSWPFKLSSELEEFTDRRAYTLR